MPAGKKAGGKAAVQLPAKQLATICAAVYDAAGQDTIHLPLTSSNPFIQVNPLAHICTEHARPHLFC